MASRTRHLLTGLTAAAVVAVAAAYPLAPRALAAANAPELARYYGQQVQWSSCGDDLECGWLSVPLDYSDPAGEAIRLRMSRIPASGGADERIGSLVANPGGPGAEGTGMPAYLSQQVSADVRRRFDLVGFDPRGVGQSAPITCLTGRQTTDMLQTDAAPMTPAGERKVMAVGRQVAEGCLRMSPRLARHVGTENTVRDLDIMRAALHDDALNWLGYSYGTYLGALYAEAFPRNVGRMVLDGAVDPALDGMELSEGQNRGFQQAVGRFAADCATRASCPYRGGRGAVLAGINHLLTSLRSRPLPGVYGPVGISEATTAVFYALYSPTAWPWLRRALAQAERGNGKGLAGLADDSAQRVGPNAYEGNMASAFPAIGCWDSPPAPGRVGLRAAADAWSRTALVPDMARSMAWGNAPCSQWYGHSPRGAAPVSSTTNAPIVVIGTVYDPATPYAWAVSVSRQLPTSTLLTYVGDGHTAYGTGSACVDRAVDAYLATGQPPAAGLRCD